MRRIEFKTTRNLLVSWLIASVCVVLQACTANMAYSPLVKDSLERQDLETALASVEKVDKGTSQLLYLYEKGLLLHYANRYEESNTALEASEGVYDELYTKSLSRELGSLFTSDNAIRYRGEQFEAALIHYFKILNYLYLSQPEGALVECRKLNHRLETFSASGDSVYVNDPFLQYLTGMVFFDQGELNDADVSFRAARAAYKKLGQRYGIETPPSLACDLVRCSEILGDIEAAERYRETAEDCGKYAISDGKGALNIFVDAGFVSYKIEQNIVLPIYKNDYNSKRSNDEFAAVLVDRYGRPVDSSLKLDYMLRVAIPAMVSGPEPFMDTGIRVQGDSLTIRTRAVVVENVEGLAYEAFEARSGKIMLKTVTRALVKYLAKETADDESEIVGWLVNLFNVVTESADIRSWSTLPQTIRLARLALPEGTYDVELMLYGSNQGDDEIYTIKDVEIKAGRATFLNLRIN
jgi:hypothetical protein